MKTEKIYTRHEQNKEWMNSLLFYNDEMKVMNHRIEEIAAKNSSKEILAQVEHFQNQLIVQHDNVDGLKHDINLSNDAIVKQIKESDVALERKRMKEQSDFETKIKDFEKVFSELKNELNVFLSKWM